MDNKEVIKRIRARIIEQTAENMKSYGVPATVGRVLGIVYYNRKPMTLDELAEHTGMSKARMSQVVREMQDYNIAERVFEVGSRKDIYDVEQDYYQTFISLFTSNWRKTVVKNRMTEHKILDELNEILKNETSDKEIIEDAKKLIEEAYAVLDFYDWLDRLVEFFESHDVLKAVPVTRKFRDQLDS